MLCVADRSQPCVVAALAVLLISSVALRADAEERRWRNLGPDGVKVAVVAADPSNPSVIYAGTDGGMIKSVDAGST